MHVLCLICPSSYQRRPLRAPAAGCVYPLVRLAESPRGKTWSPNRRDTKMSNSLATTLRLLHRLRLNNFGVSDTLSINSSRFNRLFNFILQAWQSAFPPSCSFSARIRLPGNTVTIQSELFLLLSASAFEIVQPSCQKEFEAGGRGKCHGVLRYRLHTVTGSAQFNPHIR